MKKVLLIFVFAIVFTYLPDGGWFDFFFSHPINPSEFWPM